jgi:branched-subunit amino acid aminotransferase/4-amino-4-deoxychorismate lyase
MTSLAKHAIVNGKIVKARDATVFINDKEIHYGFGVYESLKVLNGVVIYKEEHLKRLFNSADGIELRHNFSIKEIDDALEALIKKDSIKEATISITLVGGINARYFISASQLLTYPSSFYKEGIKTITYYGERFLPSYKTLSLLVNYLALREASSNGAFEALLVNQNNDVLEGTRSNFYALRGKVVWQCNEKYADRHHKCSTPHLYQDALQDLFVQAVNTVISRKDEIIRTLEKITEDIFDTSADEAQLEAVKTERHGIVSRMEQLNTENANVAMDQAAYQDRFKQLSSEYTEVNKQLSALEGTIHERKSRKTKTELFLRGLKKQKNVVTEFTETLWHALADHAVVNSKEDVRFIFKNGMEIRV